MASTQEEVRDRPAQRPTRADARRNYDALLTAADAAFTRNGTETSLEDIARQAGVAIGTLYRHFPTREVLLEAVLRDEFVGLEARGKELLEDSSPGDALFTWLDALAAHAATYQGLARSILASFQNETSALFTAHRDMQAVGAQLLARAQEAGDVRGDIDVQHVFSLSCALATATESAPDPAHARRLRAVVYDGLRTP